MIFDHYDKIVSSAETISKSWEIKRIPLKILNELINKAKLPLTSDDKFVLKYQTKHNETLDLLKTVCKTESKRVGDNKLSIDQLKIMIGALKEGFEIEQNKQV